MLKYIVLLLVGIAPNADAELKNWDKTSRNLFYGYLTLNVVDTVQTLDFVNCRQRLPEKCGTMYETNPFIGPYPSKGQIIAIKGLTVYGTYYLLDNPNISIKNRQKGLLLLNAFYINTVVDNHELGLRFRLRF